MSGSSNAVTSDLVIRARDLASEPIEALVKRVQDLSAAIQVQSKLSERGEGSAKALALAIRSQEEAVKALVAQQGKLEQFLKTSGNVDALKAAQQAAGEAVDALKVKLGDQGAQTRAQKDELRGLEGAYTRLGTQIRNAETSLGRQSAVLAKLGIDTKNLAASQDLLTEARKRGEGALGTGAVTQANAGLDQQKTRVAAAEVASSASEAQQRQAAIDSAAANLARQRQRGLEAQALEEFKAGKKAEAEAQEAASAEATQRQAGIDNAAASLERQRRRGLEAQALEEFKAGQKAERDAVNAAEDQARAERSEREDAAASLARQKQKALHDLAVEEFKAGQKAERDAIRQAEDQGRAQQDQQAEAAASLARQKQKALHDLAVEEFKAGQKAERDATKAVQDQARAEQEERENAAASLARQRQKALHDLAVEEFKAGQKAERDATKALQDQARDEQAARDDAAASLARQKQKALHDLAVEEFKAGQKALRDAAKAADDQAQAEQAARDDAAASLAKQRQKALEGLATEEFRASQKSLRDAESKADDDKAASDARRATAAQRSRQALDTAADTSQFGHANVTQQNTDASQALANLLAPAAAARTTLAGVTAEVERLTQALGKGKDTAERYHDDLRDLGGDRSALGRIAALIDAYRTQEAVTEAAYLALSKEQSVLAALNAQVQAAASVDEQMAAAVQRQAAAVAKASQEADRQNATFTRLRGQVTAAGVDYADLAGDMGKVTAAAGKITEATDKTNEALKRTGGKSGKEVFLGLRPDELYNLSYQINDVATSLASGISFAQTAAQQSGQIFQLFERDVVRGFQAVKTFSGGLINLPVVIGGVGGALGVAYLGFKALSQSLEATSAQRNFEARLAATGDAAISTGAKLTATTRQIQQFGSSFADAQKAVQEFLAAGINPSRLVEFGKTAQNVADITGQSLPDAAKEFASAFTKGFDAVVELDKQFHFLTTTTYDQIKAIYDEKGAVEGGTAAFAEFARVQQNGADKAKGEWSTAIRGLTTAWHNFLDALSNSNLIRSVIQQLTELAEVASGVLKLFPHTIGDGTPLAAAQDAVENQEGTLKTLREGGADQRAPEFFKQQEQRLAQLAAERDRLREISGATAGATEEEKARARAAGLTGEAVERAGVAARAYAEKLHEAGNRIFDPNLRGDAAVKNAKQVVDQFAEDETHAAQAAGVIITKSVQDEINKRVDKKRQELAETIANYKTEGQVRDELLAQAAAADAKNLKGSKAGAAFDAVERDKQIKVIVEQRARELKVSPEEFLAVRENADAIGKVRDGLRKEDERKRAEQDEALAKQAASANNKRLNAEEGLQAELLAIKAKADAQDKTNLDARLRAIDEEYAKTELTIAKARRAGASSVAGQPFEEFAAEIEAQKDKLKQDTTLTFYEEKVNALLAERKTEYEAINAELAEGTISVQTAFSRTSEVTSRLTGKIKDAAAEAAKFARSLPDQTPKVQSFEAKNDRLAGQSDTAAARQQAEAQFAAAMKPVNDLIKERTELETAERTLAKDGIATNAEADAKIKAAYQATTPQIENLTGQLRTQLAAQRDLGEINDTTYNTWLAKLDEVDAKAKYVSDNAKAFYKQLGTSFVTDALQGFDAVAQKLGQVAVGGAKLSDVFKTAENAFLNFAASFLKQIAEMILKQELLAAVQAAYKAVGGTGTLFSAATTVAHSGALIGSANDNVSRPIDPAWFTNAPRFHTGGIVGLAPDERAAILQTGERVLSRADVRNAAAGARGPEAASRPIRQVLVFDPSQVSQALAGSHGEQVVLTHIKNNAGAVKQLVR